jgi:hypothetical protein
VLWIFREDILAGKRGRIGIKPFDQEKNLSLVKNRYENARLLGRAVSLEAFCRSRSALYCSIYVPKEERDAEARRIAGLKFSIPAPLREGKVLPRWWPGGWPSFFGRSSPDDWIESLPSKIES